MGVRGKGTAFESPCPAQQWRDPAWGGLQGYASVWQERVRSKSALSSLPVEDQDNDGRPPTATSTTAKHSMFSQSGSSGGSALFPERDAQMPSGTSRLYYKPFAETERLLETRRNERNRFRRGAAICRVCGNRLGGPEACLVAPAGQFGKTPTWSDRTYPRGCGILGGDVVWTLWQPSHCSSDRTVAGGLGVHAQQV